MFAYPDGLLYCFRLSVNVYTPCSHHNPIAGLKVNTKAFIRYSVNFDRIFNGTHKSAIKTVEFITCLCASRSTRNMPSALILYLHRYVGSFDLANVGKCFVNIEYMLLCQNLVLSYSLTVVFIAYTRGEIL